MWKEVGAKLWKETGAQLAALPEGTLISLSFGSLILIGTFLLLLPVSTKAGISVIDALFTSTSAVCVTGLIVVDTGTAFTEFGQAVILLLIQVGGLGIITLSTFTAILLGKKIPLKQREIVRQTHSSLNPHAFRQLVVRIILFTLAIEGVGAGILFVRFRQRFAFGEALGQSVFHSISAFCNAGFSLFADSLIGFQTDWVVNLVIMSLIFLGGIGFLVIYDVERTLRGGARLSLHTTLALVTSAILIVGGTLLFLVLEYNNILSPFSFPQKLLVSLFQAVTPRTAGFNSVDIGQLTNSSLILIWFLMFVGGSPGSAAGGIKTTTLAIFLAAGYNRYQGRSCTNIFYRTVPEKVVNEAISIILISITVLIIFNFTLQWTENGAVPHSQSVAKFLETSFEAVSAFGTVGLSTGITSKLSLWGKVQIILLMMIGRVGPLTIAFTIGVKHSRRVNYQYYTENVMVG